MIIENLNCYNLLIKSDDISDLISNPNKYKSLEISSTINNCQTTYANQCIDLNTCTRNYSITFPNCCNLRIKDIKFKNVLIGDTFNLNYNNLFIPVSISNCSDISNFSSQLETFLVNNFGSIYNNFTFTCSYDSNTNYFTYNISGLPTHILPIELVYQLDGIETRNEFVISNNITYLITSEGIVLTPSFYNTTEFYPGIYSINIKLTTKSNIEIEDSNCAFIDCGNNCKIIDKVKDLKTEDDKKDLLLIHYAMVVGSNCGCNCEELNTLYSQFNKLLNSTNNECSTC